MYYTQDEEYRPLRCPQTREVLCIDAELHTTALCLINLESAEQIEEERTQEWK